MSRPMHRRHLDCATLLPVVIITHCSVKRSSSRLFTAPEPSSTVVCYGWKRNNSAKTRLAKTKVMLKTMKQMRSRTAAAIIHSFIICWFMSVWWRSSASLRSLLSSRSLIEASRRSTELVIGPAGINAGAADDVEDSDDVMTGFDTSMSSESTLISTVSVTSSVLTRVSDASRSHTTLRICTCKHLSLPVTLRP